MIFFCNDFYVAKSHINLIDLLQVKHFHIFNLDAQFSLDTRLLLSLNCFFTPLVAPS